MKKKKKYRNDIYRADNFHYDELGDFYICPKEKS